MWHLGMWSSQIALIPSCKTQGWHFPALPAVLGCKPFSLSCSLQTQLWPGPSGSPVSYTSCCAAAHRPAELPSCSSEGHWLLVSPRATVPSQPHVPKNLGCRGGEPHLLGEPSISGGFPGADPNALHLPLPKFSVLSLVSLFGGDGLCAVGCSKSQ